LTKNRVLIDVHTHIASPPAVKKMKERGLMLPPILSEWSPGMHLEHMDSAGITMAVLSSPAAPAFLDRPQASAVVREMNEHFARLVQDEPTRFGAFATLPMPSVEDSVRETVHALDTLKLDGVAFQSSYEGKYLSHPDYEELLQELNRRRAVVFIHPILIKETIAGLHPALLEGTFDTTRNVTAMAEHRIFDRFPDIRFIFPHTGGMVPYIMWRIASNAIKARIGDEYEATEELYAAEIAKLERLYYDTALNPGPLPKLIRPSQILFGSDIPFPSKSVLKYQVRAIEALSEELGEESVQAIASENALGLFPRLKQLFVTNLL